ncbi:hypothetical protein [Actinoallomurus sp. CA-142502]|uniref:hypothetical protein n=1 Tax=Actinoallomurus sp. CA-142502 TaxID=3239885 RepID=UPI003D94CD2D
MGVGQVDDDLARVAGVIGPSARSRGGFRAYERLAAEQVDRLRVQPARAEEFAAPLRSRLEGEAPADGW